MATDLKQTEHGPSTGQRTKYAKARVAGGFTYRALRDRHGFSYATIAKADRGELPRSMAVRRAYLQAIGMDPEA